MYRLQKTKNCKLFWNVTKRSKQQGKCSDVRIDIKIEQNFSPPTVQSETIKESERRVKEKISLLCGSKHDVTLNRGKIINYIMQLKLNCAPANDGITAEYLRHGVGSSLIDVITSMLTICLKFGVVSSSFRTGGLVPILKKFGCDAAVPKNWRPVVISPTLSKLLEVYIY